MPSKLKRINLTVPDDTYKLLQQYKNDIGIQTDASACLQIVTQKLREFSKNNPSRS